MAQKRYQFWFVYWTNSPAAGILKVICTKISLICAGFLDLNNFCADTKK
jgi:hypothetical protein